MLVLPALTSMVAGKRVYYAFSVHQMEDVQSDVSILPVPFAPPYVEGIADWRGQVVPILSLEGCLGLDIVGPVQGSRLMVVRAVDEAQGRKRELRSMVRVSRDIRMVSLPIACSPADDEWLLKRDLVRGVYEWEKGFLLVVHLERILHAGIGDGK